MISPNIPFAKPLVDDQETTLINEVMSSGRFVHGPRTIAFEEAFAKRIGTKHAIALSSCTAALHLALLQMGVSSGDKVIVPAMTHVATAHAVCLCRATPYFVDVCKLSGNINTELLQNINDPSIKGIIPVHYLGLPCDMDAITRIAKANDWFIIEDCALAIDASYNNKYVGSFGIAGCFSFYPTKHITSIEGGMLTTNSDIFADKIRKARAFGYNKSLDERERPGIYDIDSLGMNYRMDELRAAVGHCQLNKLNYFQNSRTHNFSQLQKAFEPLDILHTFPSVLGKGESSHYCFNIVLPADSKYSRDNLMDTLTKNNIGFSVHYPQALPLSLWYQELLSLPRELFPVSEWLSQKSISLPVGPHIHDNEIQHIANVVTSYILSIR